MEKQNSKSWFQREAWFKERLILKIKKFRNFENDYHKSVVATVGNCKLRSLVWGHERQRAAISENAVLRL